MTRVIEIWQVDAFTSRPFSGNPAGVVLDAGRLSEAQMQKIAAEMNVAETAFVAPTSRPDADFGLRWFTPSGKEVAFCGHATVATGHVLMETGRMNRDRAVFDTRGGLLPVTVSASPRGAVIWLEPSLPSCAPYAESLAPIVDALGIVPEGLGAWAPPALTSERDLLLPVAGIDILKRLSPRMERLGGLGDERRIRGFCLTARETVEPESLISSRFFAPHIGIPEDPVTGSVHASLPVWLWTAGVLQPEGDYAGFQAEQGDVLGRPGRVIVELQLDGGQPARVRVGGRAATVLAGSLRVE